MKARTPGVNAVAAPLVDWPAIHRGFASAAPAVEAAATRINEAAEALMANHFGGLGLRGPNVNDPPTYPRPPAPPRPPGVAMPRQITEGDVTAALQAACLLNTPESRKDMRRALEKVFASGVQPSDGGQQK